jgi:hypothetical protein
VVGVGVGSGATGSGVAIGLAAAGLEVIGRAFRFAVCPKLNAAKPSRQIDVIKKVRI